MQCNSKINDNLRIQIPPGLVQFLILHPGDEVRIEWHGEPRDTWLSNIDDRFCICIPPDVAQKNNLNDGQTVSLWDDNGPVICIKPAVNWEDMREDKTDPTLLFQCKNGILTLRVAQQVRQNGDIVYYAKVLTTNYVDWSFDLLFCQKKELKKVDVNSLKQMALLKALTMAENKTNTATRELEQNREALYLLRNLIA